MVKRRSFLLVLGGATVGTGAAFGSGAFTSVQARPEIDIELTGDAAGAIGIEPNDEIAAVFQDDDDNELRVDTDKLGDAGFNAEGDWALGSTESGFGQGRVIEGEEAFRLQNNIDRSSVASAIVGDPDWIELEIDIDREEGDTAFRLVATKIGEDEDLPRTKSITVGEDQVGDPPEGPISFDVAGDDEILVALEFETALEEQFEGTITFAAEPLDELDQVAGQVRLREDNPETRAIQNALVRGVTADGQVLTLDDEGEEPLETRTNEDGEFTFALRDRDFSAGPVRLLAIADADDDEENVQFADGGDLEVDGQELYAAGFRAVTREDQNEELNFTFREDGDVATDTTADGPVAVAYTVEEREDEPGAVATVQQLQGIETADADQLTEIDDLLSFEYLQVTDIDAEDTEDWNDDDGFLPIGADEDDERFIGEYNGLDFEIEQLSIDRDDGALGLFGAVGQDGLVERVRGTNRFFVEGSSDYVGGLVGTVDTGGEIRDCSVEVRRNTGEQAVGGLVGRNRGYLEGCSVQLNRFSITAEESVGGFVGENEGDIVSCSIDDVFSRTFQVDGEKRIGGFAGYNRSDGDVEDCFIDITSRALIVDGDDESVGGFVGENEGEIADSTISGDEVEVDDYVIEVDGGGQVGGFAGRVAQNGLIQDCSLGTEDALITGGNGRYVGGFVGWVRNTIQNCTVETDEIEVESESRRVGGFLGYSDNQSEVKACTVAVDTIEVDGDTTRVGGFAGRIRGTVEDCTVEADDIEVDGDDGRVGGFVGRTRSSARVDDCAVEAGELRVGSNSNDAGGFVGENLGPIDNSTITAQSLDVGWNNDVGGFVGDNDDDGDIEECSVEADEITVDGNGDVGGFAGDNDGGIMNCSFTADEGTVEGSEEVGGFAGDNDGDIEDCSVENLGNVQGVDIPEEVGGFVGKNDNDGGIMDCSVEDIEEIDGRDIIGGFVGRNEGDIEECEVTAEEGTEIDAREIIGGFVGCNNGNIEECSVEGIEELEGSGDKIGGFVGLNEQEGTIESPEDKVTDVTTLNVDRFSEEVGGFVGANHGTIGGQGGFSVKLDEIIASETRFERIGGFVGLNSGDIEECGTELTFDITGENEVGGFVGLNEQDGTIEECAAEIEGISDIQGPSRSEAAEEVGGFVGLNNGDIDDCEVEIDGAIDDIDRSEAIGGFAGRNGGDGTITGREGTVEVAVEEINGGRSDRLGGFVGDNDGDIVNCSVDEIDEINIDSDNEIGGFAGRNGGTIESDEDVTIKVGTISYGRPLGTSIRVRIGGFVGLNEGTIKEGFTVEFEEIVSEQRNWRKLGGFAGENLGGQIVECKTDFKRIESLADDTGGFVGKNSGDIEECTVVASTDDEFAIDCNTGNNDSELNRIGGFVGRNSDGGTIEDCSVDSDAKFGNERDGDRRDARKLGGFAGENDAEIRDCFVEVEAVEGLEIIGGFVGKNDTGGDIRRCATAVANRIAGVGAAFNRPFYIGGFIGRNNGDIEDCYPIVSEINGENQGGREGRWLAGFVGDQEEEGRIETSYTFVSEILTNQDETGGFAARVDDDSAFEDTFWDEETSNQDEDAFEEDFPDDEIKALQTAEMQGETLDNDFDTALNFDAVWENVSEDDNDVTDDSYPILQALDRERQLKALGVFDE